MMQGKRICVLGSANADYFLYVSNIPAKGETLQAHKYMTANGGKGANQAVAAAKLNAHTSFLGQVGHDEAMHRLKVEMQEAKVHLQWKVLEAQPTGMAYIYVDKEGENSIVIYGGANMAYAQLEPSFKSVIEQSDYLLLQKEVPMPIVEEAATFAYDKGNQTTIKVIRQRQRQLKNHSGKTVILDCGGQDALISQEILNHLTYISPNETQLLRIDPTISIGEQFNLLVAAQEIRTKLLAKHPKLNVLLKLGSKGSAMITSDLAVQGNAVTIVNPKVLQDYTIVDTVGAGDCFTAAFAVKHSQLDWTDPQKRITNYQSAMEFGNSAAFLCITQCGAMPSMPHRQTVDDFMKKYQIE